MFLSWNETGRVHARKVGNVCVIGFVSYALALCGGGTGIKIPTNVINLLMYVTLSCTSTGTYLTLRSDDHLKEN